jgi:non-heme chloroperoxidase
LLQGTIDTFWAQGMTVSVCGQYLCVREFPEIDYTEDLKKIDVLTLILQGDDDRIVPIDDTGRLSEKIVRNATLKAYRNASYCMCVVKQTRSTRIYSRSFSHDSPTA